MVSAYNYISRDPGRLYHTKGKPYQSDMFSEGCDFIDHVSGYVNIKHQVTIKATETVKAKITFEREAKSKEVVIKVYHTDNGIFNASEFMDELLKKKQNIRFSGAGASYKNVESYRAIKAVVTVARTMLMQAALRCPEDTFSIDLWPMSMDYSVWFYNRILDI